MSHSPSLSRFTPGASESGKFLTLPVNTTFSALSSDGDEILDNLRSAIAAGASALDPILTAIVEAAQTLTGASAAAVALRSNGAVICRARCGDSSPEVGSPLNEKSGITGECLRTGKTLRCDDTQKDYRVNPEVCRRLGLRSIAVLPLRSRLEIAGVLEVFSTRAYAFAETQMTMLARLAELAEAAYTQELSAQAKVHPTPVEKASDLKPQVQSSRHPDESALRRIGKQVTTQEFYTDKRVHYRLGIAAGLLLIVSLATWRISARPRHEAVKLPAQAPPPVTAAAEEDSVPISLTNITARPERPSASRQAMSVSVDRHPREQEPDPEVSDVVTRVTRKTNVESEEEPTTQTTAAQKKDAAAATIAETTIGETKISEPVAAPKLEAVASSGVGALGTLLASPTSVPKFVPPISKGVTGGTLQHRVQPVYPQQAIAARLEGPVTLRATITPEGTVGKVKVVKGHPLLAQAAMEAVRQWRYTPYQLNGEPTSVDAEIVVNFKAPTN